MKDGLLHWKAVFWGWRGRPEMGIPLESSWELKKWILALLVPSLGPEERTLHRFLTCRVVAETFPASTLIRVF